MSEIINNNEKRRKALAELTELVLAGQKNPEIIKEYRDKLATLNPSDVLIVEDTLVKKGLSIENLKTHIEKVLNVIGPTLKEFKWEKPTEADHPLNLLLKENRELEQVLKEIKKLTKKFFLDDDKTDEKDLNKLKKKFAKLSEFNIHYIKKENILFPYLEETVSYEKPMAVMWSLHDDIRKQIKKLYKLIDKNEINSNTFKMEFGNLLSLMNRMVFKEEKILYPVAYRVLKEEIWDKIYNQFLEEGFYYLETTDLKKKSVQERAKQIKSGKVKLPTGEIKVENLEIILNTLPVEITYVGKDDRVKYFSGHQERIFPRSKAIIGRTVQNCHPPESVHIVEEILKSFKEGTKDQEHFRIKMQGIYIMINYYALRDEQGEYLGTIEVTQDITEINSYEGEKRLLDMQS